MLRRALLLAPACALAAACGPGEVERPSALLVTIDTTRADALGCYGGRAGVTPVLDALARESIRFDQARTVAPLTLPAHATMLSGLLPLRHGLRDNGVGALPGSAVTLAERAREAGWQTAAFVAAIVLDARFGLDQGFEVYGDPERVRREQFSPFIDDRPAEDVVEQALAWLAARDRERPFFLWVHLYDPHFPYEPPPEMLRQAGGDAYLAEVARADRAVGRLLEALRADETLERTLVAVTSDHGEARGEHGEETHGNLCYEGTMRVPLLLRLPGAERAGEVRADPVGVADLFPTFVEALGLGAPGDVDGRSLLAAPEPGRGTYLESYSGFLNFGWAPLAGWSDGSVKYLRSGDEELYLLREDPREEVNRAAERPADVARARAAIARLAARPALAGEGAAEIDEALLGRVRALGYAGVGAASGPVPGPLEDTGLDAPRERLPENAKVHRAFGLVEQGDKAGAIAMLQEVVAGNPRHLQAQHALAAYLVEEERWEEAIAKIEELLPINADSPILHGDLSKALEAVGRLDDALEHALRAAELRPRAILRLEPLARLLEATGHVDEARDVRATIEALRAEQDAE
jgi:arylsulfatase A-like enzyme